MASAAATVYGFRRFRVSKACVVCRLRKTKCNGEQPCDRCKAHDAECVYETAEAPPRNVRTNSGPTSASKSVSPSRYDQESDGSKDERPSKRARNASTTWSGNPPETPSQRIRRFATKRPALYDTNEAEEAQDREDEQGMDIHDGIRAHDQNTGNMQFYGFTSNFNFQHRLSHTIHTLRLREQYSQSPVDPSLAKRIKAAQLPESMRTWGHQDIIFRQNLQGAGNFPTIDATKEAIGDSTFLPPSIVDRFVENFLVLIQPQLEVVPKWQIIKWMKDAKALGYISRGFSGVSAPATTSQADSKASMRTNELATLFVIMALGALMDEGDWDDVVAPVSMTREGAIACGVTLFLQAKKRLEEIVENSSITSARCLMLMGFFSLQWSSPNVAYLYLGYAARMCISIGLHRETFYSQTNPRSAEYRRLWWSCYFLERRLSTWFGQPSSIRDDDVSTRLPESDKYVYDGFMRLNAKIAAVCSDMSRLSSNPPTAAADVLVASNAMDQEMIRIRDESPPELTLGLQDKFPDPEESVTEDSDLVVRRYAVNTFWWYLRLLIHSPIVIFALYCRSIGRRVPANVLESAHQSARAGQRVIGAISNAPVEIPRPGLDNMRFGSFYLDSASTIILSVLLCDPSNQKTAFEYLASVDRAIKYLEKDKIYPDTSTKASLLKAHDLVVLGRQVVRAASSTKGGKEPEQVPKDDTRPAPSTSDEVFRRPAEPPTSWTRTSITSVLSPSSPASVQQSPSPQGDHGMQHFLSSFDWLGPMSSEGIPPSPGAVAAMYPGGSFPISSAPFGSSPSQAPLSDLDMAIIMGGVNVFDTTNQPR